MPFSDCAMNDLSQKTRENTNHVHNKLMTSIIKEVIKLSSLGALLHISFSFTFNTVLCQKKTHTWPPHKPDTPLPLDQGGTCCLSYMLTGGAGCVVLHCVTVKGRTGLERQEKTGEDLFITGHRVTLTVARNRKVVKSRLWHALPTLIQAHRL